MNISKIYSDVQDEIDAGNGDGRKVACYIADKYDLWEDNDDREGVPEWLKAMVAGYCQMSNQHR